MKSTCRAMLGILEPGGPGVGIAHRLADRGARPIQLLRQFLDGQVTAQQHLVADQDAHDVACVAASAMPVRISSSFLVA